MGIIQNSSCGTCIFLCSFTYLQSNIMKITLFRVAVSYLLSSGHLARVDVTSSVFTKGSLSELLSVLLNAHHHTFRPSQNLTLIKMEMC